jgi:hypothetical protein
MLAKTDAGDWGIVGDERETSNAVEVVRQLRRTAEVLRKGVRELEHLRIVE